MTRVFALTLVALVHLLVPVASAQSPWKAVESEGIVHFFFLNGENRIERYDLGASSWLSTINVTPPLGSSMTEGWVDEDGIYLAFEKTLKRYDLNGGNEVHIRNTPFDIDAILSDGDYIIVVYQQSYDRYFSTILKSDNSIVDDADVGRYTSQGFSIDPVNRVIFSRSTGVSPSDILKVTYDSSGVFANQVDSPHHGDYPSGTQTFVFPDGQRVVDSSGTIYSGGTLDYLASFAGDVDDIQFYGGTVPIVLRGNTLVAYSSANLETGRKTISQTAETIALDGDAILAFYVDSGKPQGVGIINVRLSDLNPENPGDPVDPVGALYTPDKAMLGADGVLYLFSRKFQSIFRWDVATRQYLETIPLAVLPSDVTYSAAHEKIYTAIETGEIRVVDPAVSPVTEVPFYNLPDKPLSIDYAGDFIFAVDPSGAWESHYVISKTGELLDSEEWRDYSREFEWCETTRKLYYFRDGTSPNDILQISIDENGIMSDDVDSPYHGGVGTMTPIRAKPDGSVVMLGSGEIFDGETLEREAYNLPQSIVDGEWMSDDALATVREYNGQTLVERYTSNYGVADYALFNGAPHRIFPLTNGAALLVVIENEIPKFIIVDSNLDVITGPGTGNVPGVPQSPGYSNLSSDSVTISWGDADNLETGFVVERKLASGNPAPEWEVVANLPANTTSFTDSTVEPSTVYWLYRIAAYNDDGSSGYSDTVKMLVPFPVPEAPSNLNLVSTSDLSVTLGWASVDYANYYRIESQQVGGAWSYVTTGYDNGDGTADATISGLTPETEYSFRAISVGSSGDSGPSPSINVSTAALQSPETPSYFITSTTTDTTIYVYWNTVERASGYRIEYFKDSTWQELQDVLGGSTSRYTLSGLEPGTEYSLRLVAYNSAGDADPTGTRVVSTDDPPAVPDTPASFILTSSSESSLSFNWSTVAGATGYRIEYDIGASQFSTFKYISGGSVSSTTVTGLPSSTAYSLRLIAFNGNGDSAPTATMLASTDAPPPPPPPPSYDNDYPVQPTSLDDLTTHFDIDWDSSPHVVGQKTAIGAPDGPSAIAFGSPTVESGYGELTQRPLVFDTSGGSSYEQIRLTLGQNKDCYAISLDVLVSSLGPSPTSDGFAILLDGGNVHRIDFEPDGRIQYWASGVGGASGTIGNYQFNKALNMRILLDADKEKVYFSLDGGDFAIFNTNLQDDDLRTMRVSMVDGSYGDALAAIDNLKVVSFDKGGDPPQPPVFDDDFPIQPGSPNDLSFHYDMDWDGAPHVLNSQTATGAPDGPSKINFGSPVVEQSLGVLDQRPLVFESSGGSTYEQIQMDLSQNAEVYNLSMDLLVTGSGPNSGSDGFTILFDGNTVSTIRFNNSKEIRYFSYGTGGLLGTYEYNEKINLRVQVDVPKGVLYVSINGGPFQSKPAHIPDGDIRAIRVSLIDTTYGDGTSAIDNVVISSFDKATQPPGAVPAAPSNPGYTGLTETSVTFTWTDESDNESGFLIQRKVGAGVWATLAYAAVNDESYPNSGLTPATNYQYRVAAFNGDGYSSYSDPVSVTTETPVPETPQSFLLTSAETESLTLGWAEADYAASYRIELFDGINSWSEIASVSGGQTTSAILTGLVRNTAYTLRLIAVNERGESPPTANLVAETLPIGAPVSVTASNGDYSDYVEVYWPVVSGAISYEIFRSDDASGTNPNSLGSTSSTTYNDDTASAGKVYYYAVKVTDGVDVSSFSGWDVGYLTLPEPATPAIVTASLGTFETKVTVSWQSSEFATNYNIYRSQTSESFGNFLGSVTSTYFNDFLVLPGEPYYYRVVAQNGSGYSPASNPVLGYARLGSVSGLVVSYHRDDGVALSWDGVVGANSYSVFRSLTNDIGTAELLGLTHELGYFDSNAEVDTEYFYFIRGENGAVLGVASSGEQGVRLTAPGYLPDLMQGASTSQLGGNNQYGVNRATKVSQKAKPVKWFFRAQNDGLLSDEFKFQGRKGDRKFKVDYFSSKGRVTASVATRGLQMGALASNASGDILLKVKPNRRAFKRRLKGKKVIPVTLSSMGENSQKDSGITTIKVK